MLIEIEAYGDFDMLYTDCIMISDTKYDIKSLLIDFADLMRLRGHRPLKFDDGKIKVEYNGGINIKKDGISGLTSKELNGLTSDWVEFLMQRGFRKLKTKKVSFSD